MNQQFIISIHAPTRGATQTDRIRDRQSYNFNPRSHEGSDGKDYFMGVYEHISIHAPTRGATTKRSESEV